MYSIIVMYKCRDIERGVVEQHLICVGDRLLGFRDGEVVTKVAEGCRMWSQVATRQLLDGGAGGRDAHGW